MKNWKLLIGLILSLALFDYALMVFYPKSLRSSNQSVNTQDFKSLSFSKPTNRKPLLLLGTTDFHGFLDPQWVETQNVKVEKAGAKLFAAVKKAYSDAAGFYPIVHVDAGDLFQGTLVSNMFEGQSVIEFLNYIKVDAVALGNHDFDYGPLGEKAVPSETNDNPVGALLERINQSQFPWLAANVLDPKNRFQGKLATVKVIERQGVHIGIIGVAGEDTPDTTDRRNLVDLEFKSMKETVLNWAVNLREEQKVDYVIVVAHSGSSCSDNSLESMEDISSCGKSGLVKMASELPEGLVDAFVGGHTHKGIYKKINGAMVIQAFSHYSYLGVAWLGDTPQDIKLNTGLIPVCSHVYWENQNMKCADPKVNSKVEPIMAAKNFRVKQEDENKADEILASYRKAALLKAREDLGVKSPKELTKNFSSENSLGNFVVDLLHRLYPQFDTVLLNNGTFRTNLPAGHLNFNHIYEIFPFDSTLIGLEVSEEEFQRMIKIGVSPIDGGLSWSAFGFQSNDCQINVQWNQTKPAGTKTIKVLTSDFIASGGVGFDRIRPLRIFQVSEYPNLREALIAGLKKNPQFVESYKFKARQRVKGKCPADQI